MPLSRFVGPGVATVNILKSATVRDTARTLEVSKRRTEELVQPVRRMLHRDDRTAQAVNRSARSRKTAARSRNGISAFGFTPRATLEFPSDSNTKIENPRITRKMVDQAADDLGAPKP